MSATTHIEQFSKTHRYYNGHGHSHFSNNRYKDSRLTVPEWLRYSKAKGMAGAALTDHGCLSGIIKIAKMMDKDPDFFNGKDGKGTFKPVVGEEIYLDDASIIEDAVKNNKKTKFYHFVLTAKDGIGLHALNIITTNSWRFPMEHVWNDMKEKDGKTIRPHGFFYRRLRRLPTYKDWLAKLMSDPRFNFKGHVIASTACLGSELSQSILNDNKPRAKRFIHYIENTFGKKQCYFEMMPAHRDSQNKVNRTLWNISHGRGYFSDDTGKGIPCIITTDAHYVDSRDRQAHTDFLRSDNPDRDVTDFYQFAHMYTIKELANYFPKAVLAEACQNSLNLLARYAPIWHKNNDAEMRKRKDHPVRLYYLQEIPKSPTPPYIPRVNLDKYTKKYGVDWSKYPYFKLMDYPERYRNPNTGKKLDHRTCRADKYYLLKIFRGMNKLHKQLSEKSQKQHKKFDNAPFNKTYLTDLNWEFMTVHQKTEHFHEPMSAYFLTVFYAVIDTCWSAGSIVGAGRGSAGEWVSNYLLGITDVNSVHWKLWQPRFLAPQRDDQPDIDLDSESSKRLLIIAYSRKKFGTDRVLNFSTFGTQSSKNTIYATCRARHINYTIQRNLASLLPADARGMNNISLHDAFYGNKKKGIPVAKKFCSAVGRYPGLKQSMLGIVGRIRGVSEHASGVAFFNEPLTQRNAMMRTNRAPGIPITQFSAHDSAYVSSMKYDILTLSTLDIIHEAYRLLMWAGKIHKLYVPTYKIVGYHKVKHEGKYYREPIKVRDGKKYSLHKTFMHYFGPQALDFTSKGMYEMLFNGDVTEAFEFSSIVGRDALLKVHATDFSALVAANSLMRLTVDTESNTYESKRMKHYWGSEQPINRYVRYRDHPGDWDKDMKKFGLTQHEMDIMHYYLKRHRGVCYSQEDLMKIDMRICYGIKDFMKVSPKSKKSFVAYSAANTLRKAVAKKDPKILEQARQSFYKTGKQRGVRTKFLDYVWYNCAVPSKNYSFNLSHGVAYTINLIMEMNICYRFGPVFWQTACLSVNAGMYGDSVDDYKNPDYDKLDNAMGDPHISKRLVSPDINRSRYGFMPYGQHILYGLYPITGISKKDCKKIMSDRKKNGYYKSLRDFVERTKLSDRKNIQLIKAGCFDKFDRDRVRLMGKYLQMAKPLRKRLTTTQLPKIILADQATKFHIPDKYRPMVQAYIFRSKITGCKKVPMNQHLKKLYLTKYAPKVQPYVHTGQTSLFADVNKSDLKSYSENNGHFKIDVKCFNRWYQHYISPLKKWLKTKPALLMEASVRRKKLWTKYCCQDYSGLLRQIPQGERNYWFSHNGSKLNAVQSMHKALPASWEMDALNCYIGKHELDYTPIIHAFDVQDFHQLPKEPVVIGKNESKYTHRVYKKYQSYAIVGTVISKTPNKALVYLLTPSGVIYVRVGKWRYPKFNKRITKKVPGKRKKDVIKSSWFDRGTRLLCIGYRRENNFFLNEHNTPYHDCMYKIIGYGNHAFAVNTDRQLLWHLTNHDFYMRGMRPSKTLIKERSQQEVARSKHISKQRTDKSKPKKLTTSQKCILINNAISHHQNLANLIKSGKLK